jgi:hypothetical protein
MWNTKSNRIMEIVLIVVIGAIVSIVNTLWLRDSLIRGIEQIARDNEENIIKRSKVININDRMKSN